MAASAAPVSPAGLSVTTSALPALTPAELAATPSAPVSLAFSSFFDDLTRQVQAKPVPWDGYVRASMISAADVAMIQAYEQESRQGKKDLLAAQSDAYAALLLRLLGALVREETVQYLLALVDQILDENEAFAVALFKQSQSDPSLPLAPFLKLLQKDEVYAALAVSKIISFLLCTSPRPVEPNVATDIFDHLVKLLSHKNANIVDFAVQIAQSLLSKVDLRVPFFDFQGGKLVSSLINVLMTQTSPQTQYQVLFCLWNLSFEPDVAKEIQNQFNIIPTLVDVAKGANKEKVIRMVLAFFRNLIHHAPYENTVPMIGSKLLPFLDVLRQRKLQDTDLVDDVDALQQHLREALQRLSTFDEYSGEVRSGKLEWSPAHESENFWKQNANKLAEHDSELARILARQLMTATDPTVLAVAAHDLGQFVKYYPAGKKLLQEVGAKHRLMEMMNHENAEVRYHALVAVQKLMSQSWDL
ncbi:hypothetical protein AMAG_00270 [Allomyces macrogynus ATCC 38327]|uniref:V-type proton ATPase subunit H n=1 Tax=Allomyces macrogynus (strain ATCC 38327) TaxID=578462 RepID=A0A0L0RV19_ALLM3|nr:hypothetical protein AMAG_00270 [Allomyces macrogynus ATCC 38327]|eukprot:KNE54282.1 hypothetical protein AMAG_00270 [Allomyces macrogynus ATCC 38327]